MRKLNFQTIKTLAVRTFLHAIESPTAYIVAIFYYGFVGTVFGMNFFLKNHGAVDGIGEASMWILWFVVPGLTMGLIAEELRSGTFEQLATLPILDWEIVLGKFLGFLMLGGLLTGGLLVYPFTIAPLVAHPLGLDWGATMGIILGQFLLAMTYGAMGCFASSLAKNQVVAFIVGVLFCTAFFFIGQFAAAFPGFLGNLADFAGITTHLETLSRGVFDFRDILYFLSLTVFFLYLTVQRLTTRRF